MLGTFDEVSEVTRMMGQMRKAFSSLQDSNEQLLEFTRILSSAIQENHTVADNIVKAVSE
jgi:hypothetical protein